MAKNLWLIAGLGNPGKKYLNTRHNVGFMGLDAIVSDTSTDAFLKFQPNKKFASETFDTVFITEKGILAKPQTFMNNSGDAIQAIAHYYKIPIERIIVIHDDVDIAFGEIKIQHNVSAGGHNGIKSIIQHMGSQEFTRIRIGVKTPEIDNIPTETFVLKNFYPEELIQLKTILKPIRYIVNDIVIHGVEFAQNKFHGK